MLDLACKFDVYGDRTRRTHADCSLGVCRTPVEPPRKCASLRVHPLCVSVRLTQSISNTHRMVMSIHTRSWLTLLALGAFGSSPVAPHTGSDSSQGKVMTTPAPRRKMRRESGPTGCLSWFDIVLFVLYGSSPGVGVKC